jgi:hexosaminidase
MTKSNLHGLTLLTLLLWQTHSIAQLKPPAIADSLFSTYYYQRVTHFKSLPRSKDDVIFLGNSITDGAEWSELFGDVHIKNRGISGDLTAGVIHRIDEIIERQPSKVFLMIGTNDLARDISVDSIVRNILWIADYFYQEAPSTKLFIQSILPVNSTFGKFGGHTSKGELIKVVNKSMQKNASAHHYTYIDVYTRFRNDSSKLNVRYTNDGLHLTSDGYLLWKHLVYPAVYDLQPKVSIIPMPQKIKWGNGIFPLYLCQSIVVEDTLFLMEAERFRQRLLEKGVVAKISSAPVKGSYIKLSYENISTSQFANEAYHLSVTKNKIELSANSSHGIFNGIQTIMQLFRSGVMIDECEITDWPAFGWRGYMIDVGRNYQSMGLLKQQIEAMARVKLNVFHLHLTEDIAWRIAIKQYPQLTAPENMLRNKGQYYSENELKELIIFCKERYITLVPEIDMPGHSAAFARATKTDMQSEEGIIMLKSILKEFCSSYNVPYLHIGADEVKITNKEFVPEISAYIESLGKKVIGWEPGGNFSESTIRQLWMDDNGRISTNPNIQYIDSRHLYLNHMDPLESVVTIFNRKIANKEKGNRNVLGGTLCMWHDRAVQNERDILRMNPVYPAILAFAERSWCGGGNEGWVANIGRPGSEQAKNFTEFENRLLDHKQQYFSTLQFPYVRQTLNTWRFFGPYFNEGDLSKKFEPEGSSFKSDETSATFEAVGGTFVLRHWWHPLIKGLLDRPEENTTWYATTRIWSDEDVQEKFWIGFNNLSRSPATDSPPLNSWDDKQSTIWVNDRLIPPPVWKHGSQKGNSEVPLIDEGYEYRDATKISLHKGWNTVLVKLPIAGFKGPDWQNPVKWMFTMIKESN